MLSAVTRGLRLLPEYGEGSPVWTDRGRMLAPALGISTSLWRELLDWQSEAYDEAWAGPDRSGEEWDEAGRRLAARLAEETGLPVEYVP
jgi:hypothetical protein